MHSCKPLPIGDNRVTYSSPLSPMKTLILDALLVIMLGLMIWQNLHLRAQLMDYDEELHRVSMVETALMG
jgi:hypothetical protein